MKKVFAILCHQITNPLIHTVDYFSSFENNVILIHVDAKVDIKNFIFLEKENVFLIQKRVVINWGEFSQIKATLNLLKEALIHDPEFTFLLSGDDIPIKKNIDIDDFLIKNNFKNLINFQDQRSNYVNPIDRIKYNYPKFFFNKDPSLVEKVLKKFFTLFKFLFLNSNLSKNKCSKFYKGTSWIGINNKTLNYIFEFIEKNKWYENIYKKSFCADEVFFHKIIKENSILENYSDKSLMSDALRYIDWKTGPQYPRILDETDSLKIKNSGMFFARKFPKDASFSFMKSFIENVEYE